MDSDKTPRRRVTPPEAFPDLDAALAARGIALKAANARRIKVEDSQDLVAGTDEPAFEMDDRLRRHPAAFVGAALGLVVIGLLVFSVFRVSDESTRPAAHVIDVPSSSANPPAPVAAAPPAPAPAMRPPPAASAPPAMAAAASPAPLPPASPPAPSALFNASNLTAQTMVAPPPPTPETGPEESLRARLHERFPRLFPAP